MRAMDSFVASTEASARSAFAGSSPPAVAQHDRDARIRQSGPIAHGSEVVTELPQEQLDLRAPHQHRFDRLSRPMKRNGRHGQGRRQPAHRRQSFHGSRMIVGAAALTESPPGVCAIV